MSRRSQKKSPSTAYAFDGDFFSKKLVKWYETNARPLPWRKLWVEHRNPWHIWVSEIMLQQTVIKSVVRVYESFLEKYPDHLSLARATPEDVKLSVRGLGYYRRFDALHRACKLLESEKKALPATYLEWISLPGVGNYTAAAIASITAGQPHGVVDGNVERVFCRQLDIRSEPNLPHLKRSFKILMDKMCGQVDPGTFNQSVMELGQTICTPSKPDCKRCPVKTKCLSFIRSSQDIAPAPKKQKKLEDVFLRLNIIHAEDGVLLLRRPEEAKFLAGTWGFHTEIKRGQKWTSDGPEVPVKRSRPRPIGTIAHAITSHRIKADVFVFDEGRFKNSKTMKVVQEVDVEKNLVSNLDRKAWNALLKKNKQRISDN